MRRLTDFQIMERGAGQVIQADDSIRLSVPPVDQSNYHNAQISTYIHRADFSYQPPLRMIIRAHAEGQIQGTAGFGFWNLPTVNNLRSLRLIKAVWFFYASPPSNMALAHGIQGYGWKAMTFDSTRWQFLALLPTAPIGFLLMRFPLLYNLLWKNIGQPAIGVNEALLGTDLLQTSHEYTLDWRKDGVTFCVDNDVVLRTASAPSGKMGFIAWNDNQYAVVTPQGRFGFGLVDVPQTQSLILEHIDIQSL